MPFSPLTGMRVLDVTTSIAGPYCAEILGALGADVIKVERPDTGDDGRAWGPPFWNGEGTMFLSANASKRSLACSLRDPRGREAVLRLVDGADVFLQSLRPGLAERLGLGADELRARNPRLVYCSIGAYGSVGPLREEPGYDALMQAAGGLISMTGEPGRPGVRVGSSLIDQGTGTWAALGILAALLERASTGEGRVVDVSLYETALGYIGYHLAGYLADGTVPRGQGTRLPDDRALPGDPHTRRRADGRGRERPALCAALRRARRARARDRPALPHEPGPRREPRRAVALLEPYFAQDDTASWHERLTRAGVPAAPVADVADILASPQTEALGIMQSLPHPAIPDLRLAGAARSRSTASASSTAARRRSSASTPPRSSREAGYADDEIAELAAAGVVRVPEA